MTNLYSQGMFIREESILLCRSKCPIPYKSCLAQTEGYILLSVEG